jgi:antitoxin VapB
MSAITKTFKSGNSVAVRLPRETGIEAGVDVEIDSRPDGVLIRRKPKKTGRDLVEALAKLPKPDAPWRRERIIFPKRRGLP